MFGFWSAVRTLYGNKLDLSFRNVLTVFVLTGFGTINPPRELGHRKKKIAFTHGCSTFDL